MRRRYTDGAVLGDRSFRPDFGRARRSRGAACDFLKLILGKRRIFASWRFGIGAWILLAVIHIDSLSQ